MGGGRENHDEIDKKEREHWGKNGKNKKEKKMVDTKVARSAKGCKKNY